MRRVEHSSSKDDWQTPDELLDLVRMVGPIGLDPCTTKANPVGARRFFTSSDNGLAQLWEESALKTPYDAPNGEIAYVNPPYGRGIIEWVEVCARSRCGMPSVLLVPARPDTAWWFRALETASAVCFWRGRLTFKGAPAPAPFPSALFYFGPRKFRFADVFQDHGHVVVRGAL